MHNLGQFGSKTRKHTIMATCDSAVMSTAEHLFTQAFGPGRLAKTAERIRERYCDHSQALTLFCGPENDIEAAARLFLLSPTNLEGYGFFGPYATAQAHRDGARGEALIKAAQSDNLKKLWPCALNGLLLIGDIAYFSRYGFESVSDEFPLPEDVSSYRLCIWRP